MCSLLCVLCVVSVTNSIGTGAFICLQQCARELNEIFDLKVLL